MFARRIAVAVGAVLLLVVSACSAGVPDHPDHFPQLTVATVMSGLAHPWDVAIAPDGTIITGERAGRILVRHPDGAVSQVRADESDLFASGETGLMGLTLAIDFVSSRVIYTCQGSTAAGHPDIRVIRWTVDAQWQTMTRQAVVIAGFPVTTGRHGGCRILAHPDGTLYIGTGDSAAPTVAQDPKSLGGKVLHIKADGTPAPGNPDPASPVFTLGHRNVQGLALQPDSNRLYSVEQGSSRDDEVNRLEAGDNYGWRPDRAAGTYDESVPMTDPQRVPGAVAAVWSSGPTTIATSGGAFLTGPRWGEWRNALALGALKGQQVRFLKLSDSGSEVVMTAVPKELRQFGRIRSITSAADGSLLITTDNGTDDKILRVEPK